MAVVSRRHAELRQLHLALEPTAAGPLLRQFAGQDG